MHLNEHSENDMLKEILKALIGKQKTGFHVNSCLTWLRK